MTRRSTAAPSRVLIILTTVVVALVLLLASGVNAGADSLDGATTSYRVQPGDTLWAIAAEVAADRDVRDVVAAIQDLNDLDGSLIRPGAVLEVPAEMDDTASATNEQ